MSNALAVDTTVETYLEKVGGDYVAAYNEILAEENSKALALRPRSNADKRKAAYAKAIAKQDRQVVKSLETSLKGFMKIADSVAPIFDESGELSQQDAEDLMVLVLESKRIKELAESQIAATRTRFFSALTEQFAAAGEEFPEYVAGYIEVPAMGMKHTREGGNRKDPVLDEEKLAELVGNDVWEQVTQVQTVRTFDPDLFLQVARKDPALLEKLRDSLTPGGFGSPSYHQRPLDADDDTKE